MGRRLPVDQEAARADAFRRRAIELAMQAKREDDPGQRRFLLDKARTLVNVADALDPQPPEEPQIFRGRKLSRAPNVGFYSTAYLQCRDWPVSQRFTEPDVRCLALFHCRFLSLVRSINHARLHAIRLTGDKVVIGLYTYFCPTIFLT
jgi:hypothetical protein